MLNPPLAAAARTVTVAVKCVFSTTVPSDSVHKKYSPATGTANVIWCDVSA